MSILVFGSNGQLGRALYCSRGETPLICLSRKDIDITDYGEVKAVIWSYKPSLVINAAAYTDVDGAETHEAQACNANGTGAYNVASRCALAGIPTFHVSTDYVFSGMGGYPWKPLDPTYPINAYGRSKLMGEELVMEANQNSYIFRTSWMFSPWCKNFVKTMLRLGETKDQLSVVSDQYGSPTYACDLAEVLIHLATGIARGEVYDNGIYHYCNNGVTTWFDFASAIFELSDGNKPRLKAITTDEYPLPAKRPKYSALDCSETEQSFGIMIPTWQDALERCMAHL